MQIAGRKWWAVAPPGSRDESDPCDWHARAQHPQRYAGCVVGADEDEAILWPDMWEHATCNLDPWVVGLPLRGDASRWPPIVHDAADDNIKSCSVGAGSPDIFLLALTVAAQHARVNASAALLDCGLPVDVQPHPSLNLQARSLLVMAAEYGHVAVVDLLLQRGALDLPDKFGGRLVHYAALKGQVAVLAHLESLGHDLQRADNSG